LFVPGTPRPVILALALHLFLAFPTPLPFLDRPRHLWAIYLPALAAGFLAALNPARLGLVSDLVCLTYSAIGIWVCGTRLPRHGVMEWWSDGVLGRKETGRRGSGGDALRIPPAVPPLPHFPVSSGTGMTPSLHHSITPIP